LVFGEYFVMRMGIGGKVATISIPLKEGDSMSTESWMVRTSGGEEWGFIKRLILDPVTNRIRNADVILTASGKIIRLPWDSFELRQEGIRLGVAQSDIQARAIAPSESEMVPSIAMDLWP
jgi:hypothetical protein